MIDLEIARAYLKSDGDDDEIIQLQLVQARSICEGYCNRKFYDDSAALAIDRTEALHDRADALASWASEQQAALYADRPLVDSHYRGVLARLTGRLTGVVIDGTIEAAILMTLGHLYRNREDNIVSGNNAVQLPTGAQRILQPYLSIGALADGPYAVGGYVAGS